MQQKRMFKNILTKIRQTLKSARCVIPLVCSARIGNINLLRKKCEHWLPGSRQEGNRKRAHENSGDGNVL